MNYLTNLTITNNSYTTSWRPTLTKKTFRCIPLHTASTTYSVTVLLLSTLSFNERHSLNHLNILQLICAGIQAHKNPSTTNLSTLTRSILTTPMAHGEYGDSFLRFRGSRRMHMAHQSRRFAAPPPHQRSSSSLLKC